MSTAVTERRVGGRGGLDRASAFLVGSFGFLALAAAAGLPVVPVVGFLAVLAILAVGHRTLLQWQSLTALLIAVVMFVPIGRFSIPLALPFGLELYRLSVAAVLGAWTASLLVDRRLSLRHSPYDRAFAIMLVAILGSLALNIGRVAPLATPVLKAITFFLSFVLVHYFIVSVVRTRRGVETVAKVLVCCGSVVAFFAVVQQRTGFNLFDHVGQVLPLRYEEPPAALRDGLLRAVGSASHPIELGAMLGMLVPIAMALAFTGNRRWWIATGVLLVGLMASVSRTPILVLVTAGLILLWLRPRDIRRLLPLLIPMVVVVKLALPGSIATVKNAFFPPGGIVAEATALAPEADPLLAGGRVRQLGPTLREAARKPVFGQGYATRQTGFFNPLRNAPILDNQWLGTALELGLVGVIGWLLLLIGAARRLARRAREEVGPDGWLAAAFAASIVAFGVGMFTFDALAFTQVTFVFWIIVSLSASLLLAPREQP